MPTPSLPMFSDLEEHLAAIEQRLDGYLQAADGCPQRLGDAMRYSVMNPGKRIRPLLVLLGCHAVGGDWRDALPAACAVEFIHVYSLIHDDLPAMDDDDLRRGKPTCHREFDEATAILAGDSLQMLAIETLCNDLPSDIALECCRMLSRASGRSHLVGGQADDLAAEGRFGDLTLTAGGEVEFLNSVHRRKTGALIETSLSLGAVVARADKQDLERLSVYGQSVGLAFQIIDDCLDVEGTSEQLGKHTRKDCTLGKLTYPSLIGIQASRQMAEKLIGEATEAVAVYKERGQKLAELAEFVVQRKS